MTILHNRPLAYQIAGYMPDQSLYEVGAMEMNIENQYVLNREKFFCRQDGCPNQYSVSDL